MPRILIASILAAILVIAGLGAFTFIFPRDSREPQNDPIQAIAIDPAEEDCQLIQAMVEKLREIPSGGSCKEFDGCAMIDQSCSSVPREKAEKANAEFERLFNKARELNCDIDYLICEFVSASCKENACIVERAVFDQPEAPSL